MNPTPRLARWWLLWPHAIAVSAFVASFGVMVAYDSNRMEIDLYLAIVGFAATGVGLISAVAALAGHPWRAASARDWLRLALHAAGLGGALALGHFWMGAHIA